jgi:hypothetical protein
MADVTQAQPAKPGIPSPVQVEHPPEGATGAKGHNDAIKAKLTANLKKETSKRAKAEAAKPKPKPAPTKTDKPAEPKPKPKAEAAPADDDEQPEPKPAKGAKLDAKAKREAARKALEADGATDEQPEPKAKPKPDEEPEEREAAGDDDEPSDQDFKKQKREFAKHKRKKEAEYERKGQELAGREKAVRQFEERASEELKSYKADPLKWLKDRGVDVRDTLVKFATDDEEDPKEKKIRELEERTKKTEAKLEGDEKDRKVAELEHQVQSEVYTAFDATDAQDYPNLWAHSEPERVARAGQKLIFRHWQAHREKLAPAEVLDMLEAEMVAHNARKSHEAKRKRASAAIEDSNSEPPDRVRSVQSETPQARRSQRRPSEDVTRRDTSLQRDGYRGTAGSFDRDATRERMLEMTRERAR